MGIFILIKKFSLKYKFFSIELKSFSLSQNSKNSYIRNEWLKSIINFKKYVYSLQSYKREKKRKND